MSRRDALQITWQCAAWGTALFAIYWFVLMALPYPAYAFQQESMTRAAVRQQTVMPLPLSMWLGMAPVCLGGAAGLLLAAPTVALRHLLLNYPLVARSSLGIALVTAALFFLSWATLHGLWEALMTARPFASPYTFALPTPELRAMPSGIPLLTGALVGTVGLARVIKLPLPGTFPSTHAGLVLPSWAWAAGAIPAWYFVEYILR